MNKKFLTAFLFGASVLASTSTFVSCKDYSDEIDALQTQIDNANALHATKAELAAAKAELTAAYEKADAELKALVEQYKAALDAKDADLQKQISDEITRAQAKEAVIEANIEALDKAHKELLDLKVDKTTFTDEVAKIYAEIKACSDKCAEKLAEEVGKLQTADAELQKQIDKLVKDLADTNAEVAANKTTLLTLKADFEKQKAACEKFQEAIDGRVSKIEADYLTSADKKELNDKIDDVKKDLQEQINSLSERLGKAETQIETNKKDIATLKTKVEALEKAVEKINKELVALTYLVKTSLRSLVFIPDAYYWGVEATEINYLSYQLYPKFPVPAEKDTKMDGKLNSVQVLAETEPADNEQGKTSGTLVRPFGSDYHSSVAKYTDGSKVLKFAAHYHLNPSKANLENAKFALVTGDREFIHDRSFNEADALLSIVGTPTAADGILTVNLDATKPELIKSVPVNHAVTIFATQVTLPKDGKGAVADTTITSDYATLFRSDIKDLVIAHTSVRLRDNLHNDEGCGPCEYYKTNSGETTFEGNHLFATWKEATQLVENGIYGEIAGAQDTCDFDKTLDLRTLVETHYTDEKGTHMYMTAQKLEEVGLKYKFDLVGFYSGTNTTSESVHAAINPEDGYTFNPQIPTETHYTEDRVYIDGGHQRPYNESAELNDSSLIGRVPIVRVCLVDAEDESKIYDYGYIPIRISYTATIAPDKLPQSVTFKGTDNVKEYCCEWKAAKMNTSWDMIEWSIYNDILHISKNVFDQHYSIVKKGDALQQYEKKDGKFQAYDGIGTCLEVRDEADLQTHTVNWTIPASYLQKLYEVDPAKRKLPEVFETAVLYKSDSPYYPDVYIVLQLSGIQWPVYEGTGLTNEMKIYEYWYKNQTMQHGTFDEVHVNTYEPENKQGHITASRLEHDIFSVYNGNIIKLAGLTDDDKCDLLTGIVFSTKPNVEGKLPTNNNGRKFQAIDGKVYVGDVRAEGKELWVYNGEKGKAGYVEALLATIKTQNDAGHYNTTFVEYAKNDIAKAILNNCDSKNFADKGDVKQDPIVTLAIDAWRCEKASWYKYTLTDYTWDVRFLRPINVLPVEQYYVDASTDEITADKHQDHVVNLRDLVELCDWRSKSDWATNKDSRVWSQICTDKDCDIKDGPTSHPADYAKDYWNYYQVTEVAVAGATLGMTDQDVKETYTDNKTESIEISGVVKTDLNANLRKPENKIVTLSSVTDMIDFFYYPNVKSNPCYGTPDSYGTLVYTNRGENINSDFHIYVPIRVKYIWGYVNTEVTLTVKTTMNDNTAKKRK